MTSEEKRRYKDARAYLGWEDAEVAAFFGYRSLDSFRRSSAYNKRRRWFFKLVEFTRGKAEKIAEARVAAAEKEFSDFVAKLEQFTKT